MKKNRGQSTKPKPYLFFLEAEYVLLSTSPSLLVEILEKSTRKTPAWDLTQFQPKNINQTESYYHGAFDSPQHSNTKARVTTNRSVNPSNDIGTVSYAWIVVLFSSIPLGELQWNLASCFKSEQYQFYRHFQLTRNIIFVFLSFIMRIWLHQRSGRINEVFF